MQELKQLSDFLQAIGSDPRIGTTHIALFAALFNLWTLEGRPQVIRIFSYQVMPLAKISGLGTYHKTIKELDAYGYLRYEPRFNRKGSKVYFEQTA